MTDSFRFARNTSMGTRARRKACHDTIPSIKASFTSEGKHTYLTRGRDRLKIGLRIDEAGGRGGGRGGLFRSRRGEGVGFNYPRVHYFAGGPIRKDPEGDRYGEGVDAEVRVRRFVLEDGITKVSLLTLINKGNRAAHRASL